MVVAARVLIERVKGVKQGEKGMSGTGGPDLADDRRGDPVRVKSLLL